MSTRDPFLPPSSDEPSRAVPPVDDVEDVVLIEDDVVGADVSASTGGDLGKNWNDLEDIPHPYFDPTAGESGAQQQSSESGSSMGEKASAMQDKAGQTLGTAQDKAGQALGAAQDKAHQATEQAHTMSDKGIGSAATGLGQAASMLRQQGESREGTLGTAATKTADTLEQASSYLEEKDTDQLVSDLEALVRRKPVESVLVAAGLGYLLSKALS
jgi:ElaB/YqjD/DUF883 family membrane-anchored ribosome-binding protein